MTNPWEWEEADLLGLIERQAEEATALDFKRCAAVDVSTGEARTKSKKELSKDISAFANAAGGTIVYGLIERDGVAAEIDEGYDPNVITREWIEQVGNSNVSPRVPGIQVKTVQLTESRPGRVAYIISIPQGMTAHQANDRVYYRRHGTECLPMEDSEIRDVMNRALAPSLSLEITFNNNQNATLVLRRDGDFHVLPDLLVRVRNEASSGPAQQLQVHVFIGKPLQPGVAFPSDTFVSLPENTYLEYLRREVRINRDDLPIYPDERRDVDILQLKFDGSSQLRHRAELPFILWRIRTIGARPAYGAVLFDQVSLDTWDCRPVDLDYFPPKSVYFDGEARS